MRIEICGGIASGKSTLAALIAGSGNPGASLVMENFRLNPFWSRFYADPKNYAFETEVTFLFQHYHDIKTQTLMRKRDIVCDFSFYQDLAYSKMGLSGRRLKIFENILEEVYREIHRPLLLIYLRCDVGTLLKRIRQRGRPEESGITEDFLGALNRRIATEVKKIVSRGLPVITIDSGAYNFASDSADQREVLSRVKGFQSNASIK